MRLVKSAVAVLVLLTACGGSGAQQSLRATAVGSSHIVRAMAIVLGREDAAALCMAAGGLPQDLRLQPGASIGRRPPPAAQDGYGLSVAASLATSTSASSTPTVHNDEAYARLSQDQRSVWNRCYEQWLGDARRNADATSTQVLTQFVIAAFRSTLTKTEVVTGFTAWSMCVADGTGITARYPWDLRNVMTDEWTKVLELNGASSDVAANAARVSKFSARASAVAKVDAGCYPATAKSPFEAAMAASVADPPAAVLAAATALEATRPTYQGWSALETNFTLSNSLGE